MWKGSSRLNGKERKVRGGVFLLFFFFPPLLSLFPPFLSCLCEHTGTLESFTDYLTHVMSF